MGNAAGLASLDSWIRQLRTLSSAVGDAGPDMIAGLVEQEVAAAIAQGRSLDGYVWSPRKADGQRAYQNAGKYVSVRRIGRSVVITLMGPLVFAQFGTGRMRSRPLLPIKGLPFKLGNAIRKGLADMGAAWMTRAGKHRRFGSGAKASMGAKG